jgi:hypothetical protein
MQISTSADLSFCEGYKHDTRQCNKPLDKRKGLHCKEHSIKIFKHSRLKRQEFASK